MYQCKDCSFLSQDENLKNCPECDGKLKECELLDLPKCMQGNIDSEKHCESCGNELFDGEGEYEICHICHDAYICMHCQNEAIAGGFQPDTCTFCAQKIWCKNCQCDHTVKELRQWSVDGERPPVLLCPECNFELVTSDGKEWEQCINP